MAFIDGKEILFSAKINEGSGAPETEQKTVELDMAAGDQSVIPSDKKVLAKVIITKPETMLPENIKEGVNIGGVIGTHKGESGGGGENAPTLFAPSIALIASGIIDVTDGGNGSFPVTYAVYVDGTEAVETSQLRVLVKDYATVEEGAEIYAIAKSPNFNNSQPSNTVANVTTGTVGLAYELQDDGTYWVTGIGTATETDIVIPLEYNGATVTGIRAAAFKSGITSIIMQDSIVTLGTGAFMPNTNSRNSLTSVILSKSITTIPVNCFKLTSLTDITLHEGITQLEAWCFEDTLLESITIPSTLKNKGNIGQFNNNVNLKTIIFKSSFVHPYSFVGCTAVEVIDLTYYGENRNFPSLLNEFSSFSTDFEIRVPTGRSAELAAMTNWSVYADNIVEV